jgi:hypothetical protein
MLIMQEEVTYINIYSVLKHLVKILIDCDKFSFLIHKNDSWGLYTS